MLIIKKTGEGYYLASLANGYVKLGRTECHKLKRDLSEIVKPHREISVDLKGIKEIDPGGMKILYELRNNAGNKKCTIRFINIDSGISVDINGPKKKRIQLLDQSEADL
ncbi:MAG: STAS domain-containing protein [Bacteroidales bacterium]|nr:STAS domain-containing protein [Bacteroidales bacterium]